MRKRVGERRFELGPWEMRVEERGEHSVGKSKN